MRIRIVSPALAFVIAACASPPPPQSIARPDSSFFGVATLKQDGEICIQTRTEEPGLPVAESYFCYPPAHPHYSQIRKHVGPISVGEEKVFGPFKKEP